MFVFLGSQMLMTHLNQSIQSMSRLSAHMQFSFQALHMSFMSLFQLIQTSFQLQMETSGGVKSFTNRNVADSIYGEYKKWLLGSLCREVGKLCVFSRKFKRLVKKNISFFKYVLSFFFSFSQPHLFSPVYIHYNR